MKHYLYPEKWPLNIFSAPFIFGMIIPVLFLDICLEVYHRICFPLYGIPYVKRAHHIIVDRHKLQYLDFFMKVSCTYCGYVNGVFSYASAIAGETEKHWCGIMHQKIKGPKHHDEFIPYGDKAEYRKFVADAREKSGRDGGKESRFVMASVLLFAVAVYMYKTFNS